MQQMVTAKRWVKMSNFSCVHQQAAHVLRGNMTRNKQRGHIVYLCHIRLPPTWWRIALRQVISALRRQGLAISRYVFIFFPFLKNK